ncbi:hypothetical protein BABINDRAFT_109890 [Babjeviella inositovora NRRL Y-12698]|uniref:Uncharacterized protein n=1 Tax=Babjeviella inositovora NRRL Y-12698 TaxID=984486 RepID=A0A1E3QX57_9ASCO|nr:uncharacterized protein BABINDRAFT_109890 [Babjeviella inositovora NRRL Y-12698]ODQ81662.1 hypothetical protein BABINDRAFT_109890 [Babjeviella inositovora NRRL Y-12698]
MSSVKGHSPLVQLLLKSPVFKLLRSVRYLIKLLSSKQFYLNVDHIFRDPTGLDYTLSFLAYSMMFVSQVILNKSYIKKTVLQGYRNVAKAVSNDTKDATPPKEATQEDAPATDVSSKQIVLATKLQLVSSYVSDIRIFNRMWACIPMIPWGVDLIKESNTLPWSNPDRLINYAQVFNGIVLQFLENVGFVGDHSFTTQSESFSLWANLWCGRLWAAYVVLDIVQLAKVPTKQRDRRWVNTLVYQLANVPLTIHWSLEEGLINRTLVGFFGALGAFYKVRDFWGAVGDGC